MPMKPVLDRRHRTHPRAQRRRRARPTWRASTAWRSARAAATAWAAPTWRMPSPRCRPATSCASSPSARRTSAIVTAYNDMLSAHQPYEGYPALIRDEARRLGATAQVAGGVPAMCDGVTQGLPGMELSLFSRDNDRDGHRDRADPRRVRRRAAARRVRQDRARPADRRAALRPPAVRLRAGRADEHGPVEQRQVQGARAARAGAGRPRRAARGRERGLPRRRHLHLLRHRQQQPDAARGDGPARAGRGLRAPARARCARR